MRRLIHYWPAPTLGDLLGTGSSVPADKLTEPPGFAYAGSCKGAIASVLGYLRSAGTLADRMSPVLAPRWMDYSVYRTMMGFCFPTVDVRAGASVLMAYHQFGFPENMRLIMEFADFKKMTVIEDCAHAPASAFEGRPLGSIGRFGVFSFSKLVFCYALGGIAYSDPGFEEWLRRKRTRQSRPLGLLLDGIKLVDEFWTSRHGETPFVANLRKAAYSLYEDGPAPAERNICLWLAKRGGEIAARQRNYRRVLETARSWGICDGLEAEGITPSWIPLLVPEPKIARIVSDIEAVGVRAGGGRFDVARFFIEPDYRPCVLLPCHSGIGENELDRMLMAVRARL
ncbi:MAG: DegT/DnrJ/EryC1/StrS family aminotransferase [Elusimicrobiota bacterium]